MSALLQGVAAMQGNPLRYKARHGVAPPAYFHNGLPYEADGALATETAAPHHFHQGLGFSAAGRLCRIGASDPAYFGSGAAPFSASRLNDIPSGAPAYFSSGVGYNVSTIGGRVAYENLA